MSAAKRLRSRLWFDDTHYPDMTALYLERYLNYGLTRDELQSRRAIIGIAQTGSDLVPCACPVFVSGAYPPRAARSGRRLPA